MTVDPRSVRDESAQSVNPTTSPESVDPVLAALPVPKMPPISPETIAECEKFHKEIGAALVNNLRHHTSQPDETKYLPP